jgi:hypothetical protein
MPFGFVLAFRLTQVWKLRRKKRAELSEIDAETSVDLPFFAARHLL